MCIRDRSFQLYHYVTMSLGYYITILLHYYITILLYCYINIGAASGAGDREVGFFMYKAIDFPSPLLLFLALFRSLSLSCSLLLSLSLSGGGGGFGSLSRSGFEFSPSAFAKKVNIWTTFRHFVSKDVFSRGTSSLF